MGGVWIVLGSGLATASGFLFWHLNSRTSRDVQMRHHAHELEMERQCREADRDVRHEEALREHLKERAQPLSDFLDLVERDQGRRLLANMLGRDGPRKHAEKLIGGEIEPDVWNAISAHRTALEISPDAVLKEYAGRLILVADAELRGMLLQLLVHIAAGITPALSESEVSTLIVKARTLIAERIIDPASPPDNLGWETRPESFADPVAKPGSE